MDPNPIKLRMVLQAEIVAQRLDVSRRCISAAAQKAVLFVLAATEGQPVTMEQVADMAALDRSTTACCIAALERQLLITRERSGRGGPRGGRVPNRYRVSVHRLLELRPKRKGAA